MDANLRHLEFVSVEDYLAGEAQAKWKHEYVNGLIYAMAGGNYAHNLIGSNTLIELGVQLKGSPCRALNSDSKVKIETGSHQFFYYPDVTVVCGENIREDVYQDKPSVIVEVLSQSTRRIDEGEKWEAYQQLDSLSTYVLFEQRFAAAIVYHRVEGKFERTIIEDPNGSFSIPEIGVTLSLKAIYDGVDFSKVREELAEYDEVG